MLSDTVQPSFSLFTFTTLILIFAASLVVFTLLVRRSTTHRQWLSLADWAGERRLKIARKALSDVPPPVNVLTKSGLSPRVRMRVGDAKNVTTIVQFQTIDEKCWNVLIRRLGDGVSRVPAGLRPTNASASVVDHYQLTMFNSLSNDRFTVVAVDGRTANRLAKSSARALLPKDVGLLVYGEHMLLDFSARPFDPTELDRLLSVAEQVCGVV